MSLEEETDVNLEYPKGPIRKRVILEAEDGVYFGLRVKQDSDNAVFLEIKPKLFFHEDIENLIKVLTDLNKVVYL